MGDELSDKLGAEIELIAGSGGVFEVQLDGREIFSKKKEGRFPELKELLSLISQN